ncbi:hypothetical protein ABZ863_03560 [Saccharomonospora sp. NPDC046836]|uniref:hypothetical protein n=1 Tax=Saccharomonospora sp. NPDC046836 TaxID=3156921 RepID=UPI0033C07C05
MPATRPLAARAFAAVSTLGLLVGAAGTFLPWLRSGTVERNSYQVAGLVEHFALLDNAFAAATLAVWVAVPLCCAACAGLHALRLPRTAAGATTLLAIIVGTVSLLATVQSTGDRGFIGVTAPGPVTTTAGMAIALAGALGTLAVAQRQRGRGRRPHSAPDGRTGVQA